MVGVTDIRHVDGTEVEPRLRWSNRRAAGCRASVLDRLPVRPGEHPRIARRIGARRRARGRQERARSGASGRRELSGGGAVLLVDDVARRASRLPRRSHLHAPPRRGAGRRVSGIPQEQCLEAGLVLGNHPDAVSSSQRPRSVPEYQVIRIGSPLASRTAEASPPPRFCASNTIGLLPLPETMNSTRSAILAPITVVAWLALATVRARKTSPDPAGGVSDA